MTTFVRQPQKDGSTRFKAVVRRTGFKSSSKTFKTLEAAQKWARKTEGERDDGYAPPSTERVHVLLTRYRNEVTPHKSGYRWETTRINRFVKLPWASLPASDCSDAISHWTEARRRKVADSTINRELNVLSSVFTHAMKRWRIKLRENPIKSVERPPKTKSRKRRVRPQELAAIQRIATGRKYTIRWYLPIMFEFAIETAMRLGELCALEWDDVHTDESWVYVRPSKNGDDRQVPMSDSAVELLELLPKEKGRVFPVNAGSFGKTYRDVCKELGLVDLHFHDTRHEAVSRLARVFPILQLAAVIGHRDLKSLQVYYNPTVQELAQHMRGSAQPKPQRPSLTT
jgi:integrase